MKKLFILFFCYSITTMVLAAPTLQSLDKIVTVVNDEVITQTELNREVNIIKRQIEQKNDTLPPIKVLQKQVLQRLINISLQLQLAKKAGITVDHYQLDKALQTVAKRNHVSVKTMRQQLSEHGISYKQYRKNIHKQLILQKLQQAAVAKKIVITPQEFQTFKNKYQQFSHQQLQYHVKDILIPLPDAPTPQVIKAAEQKAKAVLAKLNTGENFSAAAMANSQAENALQGGDLGWRRSAELPQIFSDKVASLKLNQIAGPIRAANGFHIIKLVGKRSASNAPKSKSHKMSDGQLHQMLFQRKFQQALMTWIQEIRSQAYVKIIKKT